MSKRYGRNQKRKHLAQIQLLERMAKDYRADATRYRIKGETNERIVYETAQLLGPYFMTLEPEYHDVGRQLWDMDYFKAAAHRNAPRTYEAMQYAQHFVTHSILDIRSLPVMRMEHVIDPLRGLMHIGFTWGPREMRYALTKDVLLKSPEVREQARRNIERAAGEMLTRADIP